MESNWSHDFKKYEFDMLHWNVDKEQLHDGTEPENECFSTSSVEDIETIIMLEYFGKKGKY